jgi:hypothetical protein
MAAETGPENETAAPRLNTKVPHSARIWNYWLGGKDNFAIDRELGEQLRQVYPAIADLARSDRQFLNRAVRYLAGEAGIRQFLDIGSGLPTIDNTHEVAQRVAPESRIVYIDNDPMVILHARVLLTSGPEGATDYIEADFRDPDALLAGAARNSSPALTSCRPAWSRSRDGGLPSAPAPTLRRPIPTAPSDA